MADESRRFIRLSHSWIADHFEVGATTRITRVDPEESTSPTPVTVAVPAGKFFCS